MITVICVVHIGTFFYIMQKTENIQFFIALSLGFLPVTTVIYEDLTDSASRFQTRWLQVDVVNLS
jgi:hypothetical protein